MHTDGRRVTVIVSMIMVVPMVMGVTM